MDYNNNNINNINDDNNKNKRKKIKIIIFIIIALIACGIFVAYKIHYINYYDINELLKEKYDDTYFKISNIPLSDYDTMIKSTKYDNTITINKKTYNKNNNIKFERLIIDLKDNYLDMTENKIPSKTANISVFISKKDTSKKITFQSIKNEKIDETSVLIIYNNLDIIENNKFKSIESITKKYNITTNSELIQFIEKNKNVKNTIFTPVKKMEENYIIQFIASFLAPYMIRIEGDITGYGIIATGFYTTPQILLTNNNDVYKIVLGINDNKDTLIDFINSIVIEK